VAQSRNSRRRSARKRQGSGGRRAPGAPPRPEAAPRVTPPPTGTPSIKASRDEAPKAIWAPLPITELLILLGIVTAVVGVVRATPAVVLAGLVVVMVPSLELALREHFAGYRSHSAMLAGVLALVVGPGGAVALHALDVVDLPVWALAGIVALVFVPAFTLLRRAFRRRSGGLSFRV
jgi:hypothetical protein